jgi:hypothetical protein
LLFLLLLLHYSLELPGTLPSAWSSLPKELYVGLAWNTNITGPIPASFVSNTGTYYDLFQTSITGCVPPGLLGEFRTWQPLPNGTLVLQDLPLCGSRSSG